MSSLRTKPRKEKKLPYPEMVTFSEPIFCGDNSRTYDNLITCATDRVSNCLDTRRTVLATLTKEEPLGTRKVIRPHRTTTLYCVCEGGLFARQLRDNMLASKVPFTWKNYYGSLLGEKIDVRAIALLRVAVDGEQNVILLSSTPKQYSHIVINKLKKHGLSNLFTGILFKKNPQQSTDSFFEQAVAVHSPYVQKLLYSTSWKPKNKGIIDDWFV